MGTKDALSKIKNYNEQLILRNIYLHGPIARIELAKKLKLSPTAVSDLTRDLLKKKLIIDNSVRIPQDNNGAGRPGRGVVFNPDAGRVFVVKEETKYLDGAILNLSGEILYRTKIEYDINQGYESFLKQLTGLVDNLIAQNENNEIWGIGIIVRGVVVNNKVYMHSQHKGWGKVDLHSAILKKYNLSPYILNYPNSAAVGELKHDINKKLNNILYINWGMSIGMGIIINRKLYEGSSGMSGEIGHVVVDDKSSKRCYCGKYGCMEAVATGKSLIDNIKSSLKDGVSSALEKYTDNLNIRIIIREALKGDKLAHSKLKEKFSFMGRGLAVLSNIFDPDAILIGGEMIYAGEEFLNVLKIEYLEEMMSIPIVGVEENNRIKVQYTDVNDLNVFLGGVTVIVDDIVGV